MSRTPRGIVWVGAFLATLGLGWASFQGNSMSAMNCQILGASEFKAALDAESAGAVPPPTQGTPSRSTFRLKNFNATSKNQLLFMASDAAGGLIHKGPFQDEITIATPPRAAQAKGWDNFRIVLLTPSTRQVCVAEQNDKFWVPGKVIAIELLPDRGQAADGVPVAFRITPID